MMVDLHSNRRHRRCDHSDRGFCNVVQCSSLPINKARPPKECTTILVSTTSSYLILLLVGSSLCCCSSGAHAFTFQHQSQIPQAAFVGEPIYSKAKGRSWTFSPSRRSTTAIFIRAPPGSGYQSVDEEPLFLPESYEPMMEYPGTMRPGRTPENAPFQDLPLGDEYSERDPVPWPHFQQIEWHHRWDPPHEGAVPMEEFIEQAGRWATPEQEAMMRAGTRRASKLRREAEESKKSDTLIVDDDEDDENDLVDEFPQDLGEGIFGNLGSTDDQKITAAATSPDEVRRQSALNGIDDDDDDDIDTDDPGLDDFLLDLGLDSFDDDEEDDVIDDDDDDDTVVNTDKSIPGSASKAPSGLTQGLEDVEIIEATDDDDFLVDAEVDNSADSPEVTASIDVDDDDELDLGLDEEDDLSGGEDSSGDVPLEDLDEDDIFDSNEFFDDGGFDYDDGDFGDFDGGDFD